MPVLLEDLQTPAVILDLDRLEANCENMIARAGRLGVRLRPHMKTAKSVDVARLALGPEDDGIAVSTLSEIAYFGEAGFRDVTYAVGIDPHKVDQLTALQRRFGMRITLIADNVTAVQGVAERAQALEESFSLLIEIDCGAGRGGVTADGQELLVVAKAIAAEQGLTLSGVLTHAGHSYGARSVAEVRQIAEEERAAVVLAAERLRQAGHPINCISVGSTPTALGVTSLEGVTEMRPGVYMLCDLDQVSLGLPDIDDIALSVLTTVIGHNPRAQRILVDAGGLALSKDLSAGKHDANVGYGLACPVDGGTPIPGLHVAEVHQEHGFVAGKEPFEILAERYPVGTRLRILPNHACMTAAPYDRYHLVRARETEVLGVWPKNTGWTPPVGIALTSQATVSS